MPETSDAVSEAAERIMDKAAAHLAEWADHWLVDAVTLARAYLALRADRDELRAWIVRDSAAYASLAEKGLRTAQTLAELQAAVAGLVAHAEWMVKQARRVTTAAVEGPISYGLLGLVEGLELAARDLATALAAVARSPDNVVTSSPASPAPPSTPPEIPGATSSASGPPPLGCR